MWFISDLRSTSLRAVDSRAAPPLPFPPCSSPRQGTGVFFFPSIGLKVAGQVPIAMKRGRVRARGGVRNRGDDRGQRRRILRPLWRYPPGRGGCHVELFPVKWAQFVGRLARTCKKNGGVRVHLWCIGCSMSKERCTEAKKSKKRL